MIKERPIFTAGPWTLTEGYKQKVFAQSGAMTICDIRGWGYLTGVGGLNLPASAAIAIQDANADLIVAAPELYSALESSASVVCSLSCESVKTTDRPWHHSQLCESVTNALKKARGEQ